MEINKDSKNRNIPISYSLDGNDICAINRDGTINIVISLGEHYLEMKSMHGKVDSKVINFVVNNETTKIISHTSIEKVGCFKYTGYFSLEVK